MTNENVVTPLEIEAIEKETKAFECPNCGIHLQFRTVVKVSGVQVSQTGAEKAATEGRPQTPPKILLQDENARIIAAATEGGALLAFENALKTENPNYKGAHTGKYFLTWLQAARRIKAHQLGLRQCLIEREREAAGDLELWGFQYVAAVLADGEFRCFLPMSLAKGKPVDVLQANGGGEMATRRHYETATEWIRTRFGYVAGRGLLLSEMRKRAAGDFAKAAGNF
jgi:hypothetical protein